jgi:hypothetical protein
MEQFNGAVPQAHLPLASEKIVAERKTFFIDLKENTRGRFYKIAEDANGRRNTIMLPAQIAVEFVAALRRLGEYEAQLDRM